MTPFGAVANTAVTADANGVIYAAWDTSTSRVAGQIFLATFNSSTNEVGAPEPVADATALPAAGIQLAVTPAGDVWITYTAPDGLYACDGATAAASGIARCAWQIHRRRTPAPGPMTRFGLSRKTAAPVIPFTCIS